MLRVRFAAAAGVVALTAALLVGCPRPKPQPPARRVSAVDQLIAKNKPGFLGRMASVFKD